MPASPAVRYFRREQIPGMVVTALAVGLAFLIEQIVDMSPLVVGVVLGMIATNAGLIRDILQPGVRFAGKNVLRWGIVLLGLRLSFDEVRALGIEGVAAVVVVVLFTFVGVQLLARMLGLTQGLGLLVATGYSICGASAVAAMEPLSDADEEETAYAIGLVALCGSLSIFILPLIGRVLGLSDETFGTWVGAGVHDVGQVTATASAYAEGALPPATLVKLTRVMLLAPMVLGVGVSVRRRAAASRARTSMDVEVHGLEIVEANTRVPIAPLFVVGFLLAIGLRATGWLSADQLANAKELEKVFLTAGMFGLGSGVSFARLRRLGGRPLVLGLVSWILVASVALAAAILST